MTQAKSSISKQIQYYLSDDNLQNDQFFYKEVASNKDHFVKIAAFLNCNKIKKLGVSKITQIIEAVQKDQNLQLNQDKTMLRRKTLEDLPEFKAKKKVKVEDQKQPQNPYQKIEPVIFTLGIQKQQAVSFRYIQQALLKTQNVFSPYTRFNKTQGNFAIDKKNITPQIIERLVKDGLTVGNTHLTIAKTQGDALNQFWQKHGHHYNGIIDNLKKTHTKKAKQQKRHQQKNKKISQFQFGGQKYDDINKLKSLFKNILCRNPNNVPLKQTQAKLVSQLLSYHQKKDQKLKNFKHFVVDVHPQHNDTRCLFVVRQDGTKQDFSIVKCIGKIQEKNTY